MINNFREDAFQASANKVFIVYRICYQSNLRLALVCNECRIQYDIRPQTTKTGAYFIIKFAFVAHATDIELVCNMKFFVGTR